jgi:cysteine desulfurase
VSFPGVEARRILEALPEMALSTGSACNSAKSEGSHVLRALGLGDDRVFSSLRLGLGRWTTEAEVDRAADAIASLVLRFRKH